jgi:hypothetical protein
MTRAVLILVVLLGSMLSVRADDFSFDGYGDLRLLATSDKDSSWFNGGLGKLPYGKGDSAVQFAGAVGELTWDPAPELLFVTAARAGSNHDVFLDPLESYVRYRPVSTNRWRWSIKGGAFFAPFSLENIETGWAPYWTLTPSAINSWFGDEFRTIGSEARMEWRGDDGTMTLLASAFGWNNPAGVIMAYRGWTLDDQPAGLFDRLREPDATLLHLGDTPPGSTPIFKQFDGRAGWYAGAIWNDVRQWQLEGFYYDNQANPGARDDGYFAWHTKFWDAGFTGHLDDFTLVSQAVTGLTYIAPTPSFYSNTNYSSAFLLLGWEQGDWRIAGRGELFRTNTDNSIGASPSLSENGRALTADVSWLPREWVRLTGEIIAMDSTRQERTITGLSPYQAETLFQLSGRLYLSDISF